MTWQLLNENIQAFTERQEALEKIAKIVAGHPDWHKAEPQLKAYLETALRKAA
ncbi:MAG: hypothetical protein KME45_02860 [Stenomitos rutilans HA7619-LM2]|jgi:hypothetical protein|nr:hypothetical protein [Stenomitos rutilans HA7619-LM2]MBW4469324.1 hypothetical protein [Stenomitos rutilans HA7619-LM2]